MSTAIPQITRRRAFVSMGETIEHYQENDWSPLPKGVCLEDVWQLCGPQVDRHIQRIPLWQVFAMVYFEGFAHGVAAEKICRVDQPQEGIL